MITLRGGRAATALRAANGAPISIATGAQRRLEQRAESTRLFELWWLQQDRKAVRE